MKKRVLYTTISILALALVWVIAFFAIGNEYLLPSPWDTLLAVGKLFGEGSFYLAFWNTLLRALLAFVFSLLLGVGLALGSNLWEGFRALLAPLVSLLRTLPTMAIILILLLWTSPATAPVIVTMLVLFPIAYTQALATFDGIKGGYREFFTVYRVSTPRQILKAYLPLSAPALLSQVGSWLSMGLKITISAEVLALTYKSLGGLMTEAQMYLQIPRLLGLTVVAVLVGFALEGLCAILFRKVVRWQK